jgi:trigger factor
MNVTTERLEDCQVKVFVELDAAEIDKRLRETARKLSRQFNVPGYRRGKAPYHAVVRVFGREAIQQQGIEDFGNDLYEEAIKQVDYEPYESGELEDVEWEPFRMTVLLPIRPEVDLGEYRAVQVPFEAEEITDELVDEYLASLQKQYAQWVPVERAAAIGDQVVLDIEGKTGDEQFIDNKEHEMTLEEDSDYPVPGFHQEIVGMSPGEEKTFTLLVPEEDADEDAAGQEGVITVQLHTVKEEDLPELDDDLATMVGDYETLDELRTATQENMETDALQRAESEYLDKVLDAMIETAVGIEYPPQAVDREAEVALSQMERNLAASGIELDTYLGMIGKTREIYQQELHPAAEERLQKRLVMTEITEQEGLSIEDEQIDAEIERLCESMGEQADEMRQVLETPMGRLSVTDDLMVAQAQERIILIAKGEAPPLEEEADEAEEADAAEAAGGEDSADEVEAEAGGEEEAPEEAADDAEAASGEEVEAAEEPVDEAETMAETAAEADADDKEPESE